MKKKKTDKEKLHKIQSSINREEAKEQGFYDGRFRNKVIPNKKRKSKRIKINPKDLESIK